MAEKTRIGQLLSARERLRREQERFAGRVNEVLPTGTHIGWRHGHRIQHGEVLQLDYTGDRARVRSSTGKEYWVSTWSIVSVRA